MTLGDAKAAQVVDDDLHAEGDNVVDLGARASLAIRLKLRHLVRVHVLVRRLVHVGRLDDGVGEHALDSRAEDSHVDRPVRVVACGALVQSVLGVGQLVGHDLVSVVGRHRGF